MPHDPGTGELRALQMKAYGRGGGLSDAEVTRLRELEARRDGRGVEQPGAAAIGSERPQPAEHLPLGAAAPFPVTGAEPLPVTGAEPLPVAVDDTLPVAEPVEAPGAPDARESPRRRHLRRWFAAAVAAAVALGVGIGWAVWEWDGAAAALAATHAEQRAELEARNFYDPGSVVAMAEEHGVVVWSAQRSNGEQECVILTSERSTSDSCVSAETFLMQGSVGTSTQVPSDEEGSHTGIWASIVRSTSGDRFVVVQASTDLFFDWESQYAPDDLEVAHRLEAAGFDGASLQIVGYDGRSPVWLIYEDREVCLLMAEGATLAKTCGSFDEEALMVAVADGSTGVVEYHVRLNTNRGPVLTIVRNRLLNAGESIELSETIEIEIDEPVQ